jgi:hypothetical protein
MQWALFERTIIQAVLAPLNSSGSPKFFPIFPNLFKDVARRRRL